MKLSLFIFAPTKMDGVVAQLVEQRTENPCVTGSIPVDATPKKETDFILISVFFIFVASVIFKSKS